MSRTVDVSDPSKLSESDAYYAFDRGLLSDKQMDELGLDPRRSVKVDDPPHLRPHTGDANTRGLTQEDLDDRVLEEEDLEPKEANLTEPQLQGYEPPELVPGPDEDKDEGDDEITVVKPSEGWNKLGVDKLRVACVERDLSTSGNKPDLVARLEAYDRGEEEEVEEV
jgi:hypothetical protein